MAKFLLSILYFLDVTLNPLNPPLWRLKIEKSEVIDLTIDTMVMDNDESEKRDGVQPTYKKKKGFQPLQIIWNGKIVDAVFRGGRKHSNYGNTVVNMVKELVKVIRQEYSENSNNNTKIG